MILVLPFIFIRNYVGLSIWPFIVLREDRLKEDLVLVNHERIHLRQQLEMFIIPFYLWYLLEWCVRFCMYRNAYLAYQNLSFEREAYLHEGDLNYLNSRNPYSFIKYLWP
ncbi:hypothetical protein LVD13_08855 [Flavobacteriaceae bacterium D16]|nr:hypothetical protein [Flavobacteriaceae bacterium D16]